MTKDCKKYIEEFWHKYAAMNAIEAELPPMPPKVFFELMNFAHDVRLNSGNLPALIEADIQHHIAVQKVFKKWREVYGERVEKKVLRTKKSRRKK